MHIGKFIQQELRRRGLSVTWFANELHVVRTNAYNIFSRSSIDTELLYRISKILNHDFFKNLSEEYEKKYKYRNE